MIGFPRESYPLTNWGIASANWDTILWYSVNSSVVSPILSPDADTPFRNSSNLSPTSWTTLLLLENSFNFSWCLDNVSLPFSIAFSCLFE